MANIDEIYHELSRLNLAGSKSEYSMKWLGMEKSYYRSLKCKGRQPSTKAYGRLAYKLFQEANLFKMIGQDTKAKKMHDIAARCMVEIITASKPYTSSQRRG
jgi:hypothetical protein